MRFGLLPNDCCHYGGMQGFGWLDILCFVVYLVILLTIARLSQRPDSTIDDYVSGAHHIPWWAAAMSFMATALSAATFLANPDQAFKNNISFVITGNVSSIIALLVVSIFFIPAFYKLRARTVYDVLYHRFGEAASIAGSASFIIGRLLASGVRLFMASIPLAMIMSGSLAGSLPVQCLVLFIMVSVSLIMIYRGGIRSVIWTDVAQFIILIGAALVTVLYITWTLSDLTTWDSVWQGFQTGALEETSKLALIDFESTSDFSIPKIIGISLLFIGAYGCDQDMTQRLMTCKDTSASRKSIWTVIAISIPKDLMFAAVGLALFAWYMHVEAQASQDAVFAGFIFDQMPTGIKGLAVCGLCAAAVSGLTSEINALATTFTVNVLKPWKRDKDEVYFLRMTRYGIPAFGLLMLLMSICIAAAYNPESHESLLSYAFKPMIYAYSGLVGIFFCALFTRRGSSATAIAGLLAGFAVTALLNLSPWIVYVEPATEAQPAVEYTLGKLISFPWQMTIATAIAFVICCSGSKQPGDEQDAEDDH